MNAKTVCLDLSVFDVDGDPRRNLIAKGWTPPAESVAQGGMGDALPEALLPHAKEWYRLCERRFAVDKITISGELAEAIVEAMGRPRTPTPATGSGGEKPRPMNTAPKDGTIVRLLVDFTDGGFEDGPDGPTWTIGQNGADHHPEDDEWLFAGWNWEQDCFTQGEGEPVGWLPMLDPAPAGGDDDKERCEGGQPECGPVEHHDSEGVPLCKVCWEGLIADSAGGDAGDGVFEVLRRYQDGRVFKNPHTRQVAKQIEIEIRALTAKPGAEVES